MSSNFIRVVKDRKKQLFVIFMIIFFILGFSKFFIGNSIYNKHEEKFAYQQAKTLTTYILNYRHYYQNLFLGGEISLDEKTLSALPAYALVRMNEVFSKNNLFGVSVKTISDKPRNPKNMADKHELSAISKFQKEPNRSEIFEKIENKNGQFYQYSEPLVVKESCLKCHATKENAPKYISSKYEKGYGYSLGDLRGIISVRIPTKHVEEFFSIQKTISATFDFLMLLLFLTLLYGAYKVLSSFNEELETEVEKQTKTINDATRNIYHYKKALDDSSIVSVTNAKGVITYINDNFEKISGYAKNEVVGKHHNTIRHPDMPKEVFEEMWKSLLAKKIWQGVIKNQKKDGGYYVVNVTIEPILDEDDEILEFIAVRHDITDIYDKQKEIEKISKTDATTMLGNRTKLMFDLENKAVFCIALFDIDNFSNINDFYGHSSGDFILKEFGKNLQTLSDQFEVYRYSNDKFALVSSELDRVYFLNLIYDIHKKAEKFEYFVNDVTITLQLSVSISFEEPDKIIQTADMAMTELKKRKLKFLVYDKSLGIEKVIQNNIEWTTKIRDAIEEKRVVNFYQPILNNKTKKIEKYESLVRIRDVDGTIISPFKFLEIAKKSKQYIFITKAVIENTFEKFRNLDAGFSINLTVEDILSDEIISLLDEKVKDERFATRVVYEIVESEGIENLEQVTEFIAKSKECSCSIAIDDFGTGYSNFDYLVKLSPNFLKIDGSMIRDIDTNRDSEEIVKTIIDFAKKRNMLTIAEFVSSKTIFDKVVSLGIDYSQGYYIGEPKEELLVEFNG